MTLPGILQQLGCLDKSLPQFPDQLTSLLHEKAYKDCIQKLRDDNVVWLVEYLDNVCLCVALLPSLYSAGTAS